MRYAQDVMREISPATSRNWLLTALPPADFARVRALLEPFSLPNGHVLWEPGASISHVYFPERATLSVLTVLRDGRTTEAMTIGNEGMAGIATFLGDTVSRHRVVCQVPGDMLRMDLSAFQEAVTQNAAFRDRLRRYTVALFTQIAQTAACNYLHSVAQRCALWLLRTHDRTGSDRFPLTHQFLALMLAVRRASVTVAVNGFQTRGLLRSVRGQITVLDRPGLEAAACECYGVVVDEFRRLLG